MPDVSTTIDSVSELLTEEIIDDIKHGQNVLNNLRDTLKNSIDENIPKLTDAIEAVGK